MTEMGVIANNKSGKDRRSITTRMESINVWICLCVCVRTCALATFMSPSSLLTRNNTLPSHPLPPPQHKESAAIQKNELSCNGD